MYAIKSHVFGTVSAGFNSEENNKEKLKSKGYKNAHYV